MISCDERGHPNRYTTRDGARRCTCGHTFGTPARSSDPTTSHQANPSTVLTAALVYMALQEPATDEELVARLHERHPALTPSGIRTRRSELVDAGKARDTGLRRQTRSGRQAVVWGRS